MTSNDSIHRLNSVIVRVGLSKATLYKMIKAGSFPASKRLGLRSVGWLESDLKAWIESRTSTNA